MKPAKIALAALLSAGCAGNFVQPVGAAYHDTAVVELPAHCRSLPGGRQVATPYDCWLTPRALQYRYGTPVAHSTDTLCTTSSRYERTRERWADSTQAGSLRKIAPEADSIPHWFYDGHEQRVYSVGPDSLIQLALPSDSVPYGLTIAPSCNKIERALQGMQ